MGKTAQALLDASLDSKLGLLRLENGEVRSIIRLLDASDADLEQRITRAYERALSEDTVRRLKFIRQELRSVNAQAYQIVGRELSADLKEIAVRHARATAAAMEDVIPLALSMTRPSKNLLEAIVVSKPFQGALLKDHVAKLAGNRLDALTEQMDIALSQSESLSQVLARIRGTRAGNFQDGVLGTVGRRQAETITRTALQHVTESATELLHQQNDDLIAGVMWVATLDSRTCRICQPRDGLVWVWDPETGGYTPDGHDLPWLGGPGKAHFL